MTYCLVFITQCNVNGREIHVSVKSKIRLFKYFLEQLAGSGLVPAYGFPDRQKSEGILATI